jgi:L-alanine-DL-glutamate epimerase-like enolase superfamily enzyme
LSAYAALAELPLRIDSYAYDRLELDVSSGFRRVTTVIRLRGAGEEGIGEDVTYDGAAHPPPDELPLAGPWTLDSFSEHLGSLQLFPVEPEMDAFRHYRRWGFESAALDLALRQAGRSLASALGREPRPVRFVVSTRLGETSSTAPLRALLERYPGTRFKLDPTSDWSDELVAELAALEAVDVADLKGAYHGTVVDQPPDPELYERVARGFPRAWIEDPALTPETESILAPHRDRITWDAPIHSVADVDALPFPPRTLNVKPSRFGSVRSLMDFYDACEERGIGLYGGGQFELGPGRGQIQYLASLFHPDSSNDVAPGGYNATEPPDGLPVSPYEPGPDRPGFRWTR